MAEDLFTDSEDTLLATHDSNWADARASVYTVADVDIQADGASAGPRTNSADPGARYTTSSEDISEVVVSTLDGSANPQLGLFVRSDGTTIGYQIFLNTDGTYYTSNNWYIDNTFFAGATTWTNSATYAIASEHTIRIECVSATDDTINIYCDDVLEATKVVVGGDRSVTSGNPGFFFSNVTTNPTGTAVDAWNDGVVASSTSDVNLHGTGRGIGRGILRKVG